MANRTGGVNDKANNELAFIWLEYIRFFQPETASFENVTGVRTPTIDVWSFVSLFVAVLTCA